MKNGFAVPLAVVVALMFIVAALIVVAAPRAAQGERPLPEVALEDIDGNTVLLHKVIEGRVAIINAWASWCPYCTRELPDFVHVRDEFGDQVAVIAVNRKESRDDAREYLAERTIDAHDLLILFDTEDVFYKAIQGVAMPETIVVDARGMIVFHKRGPMSLEEMREVLTRTLGTTDEL